MNNEKIWNDFFEVYSVCYSHLFRMSQIEGVNHLIANRLRNPRDITINQHRAYLEILSFLSSDKLQEVFDVILENAVYFDGFAGFYKELVYAVPMSWVDANFDKYILPILQKDDYKLYRRVMSIFHSRYSSKIALRVAKYALRSNDIDVKEVGEDYFEGN